METPENPADRLVKRFNDKNAASAIPPEPVADPRSRETEMLERIARLEDIIESLAGGASGQVLSKTSGTDHAFAWVDMADPADVVAASAAAAAAQLAADNANAKIDGASISGECVGGDITVTFTPGTP